MRFHKQVFLFLFIAAVNCSLLAQSSKVIKPTPVTDSVAAAMCNCIVMYKDSIVTRQQLFTVLQNCLQQYSVPRMDALLAEDGYIPADDRKTRAAAIRKVGQKLGQKVSADCVALKALLKTFTDEASKKELH